MKVLLGIFLFLIPGIVFAQVVTKATSNKSEYEYGEVIEVSMKVTNTSDEPFAYWGSSTGKFFPVIFSGIYTGPTVWTADEFRDTLWKDQSIETRYLIDPEKTNLPALSGEQTVVMQIYGVRDSVKFNAPKYNIEEIYVYFDKDFVDSTLAYHYADSLSYEVIEEYKDHKPRHPGYYWKIDGVQADSLVTELMKGPLILIARVPGRQAIELLELIYTSNERETEEQSGFSMNQNYPNPFNPETKIEFTLSRSGYIELTVFDLMGRKVRTLIEKTMASGDHTVNFNSGELPSGTYIYRLKTSFGVITKKLTLIK